MIWVVGFVFFSVDSDGSVFALAAFVFFKSSSEMFEPLKLRVADAFLFGQVRDNGAAMCSNKNWKRFLKK